MPSALAIADAPRDVRPVPVATVHRIADRDRDHEEHEAQRPRAGGKLLPIEHEAIAEAARPFKHAKALLDANDEAQRKARYGDDLAERAKAGELANEGEAIKTGLARARGAARVAILDAIESAAQRAGAQYHAACRMLGDSAAELEGLATLRDELLGQYTFDPIGAWARSALLAPPPQYRPKGSAYTCDAWGRDCAWSAGSPAHAHLVRRAQQALRDELAKATGGAPWPF